MNFFVRTTKIRNISLEKVITLLLIVFPIFSRYSSPIGLINLSEFVSIILLPFVIVFKYNYIKVDKCIMLFILYIIIQSILLMGVYAESISNQLIGTSIRLVYIYLILNIFGKNFFNIDAGKNILIYITLLISFYAIIQYYFATKGIILTTYIPGLRVMEGVRELENVDDVLIGQMNYGLQFRPRSILNEPAHLGTYIVVALAITIFDDKKLNFTNFIYAIIFSITCMLSRSSTAIILMILIWGIFVINNIHSTENQLYVQLLILFTVLIIIYSMFRDIQSLNYFITKTFGQSRSISEIVNTSRFNQINESFKSFNGLINYVFGKGRIRIDYYLPGFIRLIYNFGILGFITYLYMIKKSTLKNSHLQKIILLIYLIINIGTEVLFGNFIFIFLPFILNDELN